MNFFKMPDREWGLVFFEGVDFEAQMAAVRSLIHRNRQANVALNEEIKELASHVQTAEVHEAWIAESMWVDQMEHSVFQDAANSMAAVGMLAPMFEGLFTSLFAALGQATVASVDSTKDDGLTDRERRSHADYWDPHVIFESKGRRESLVDGIRQLAVDTKLTPLLPKDYGKVLMGLFLYRNMMFHNGFEWPSERRAVFAAQIASHGLPQNWFRHSSRNGEPWIYYMTELYVDRCLTLVDEVLTAVGKLTKPQSEVETNDNSGPG